MRESANYKFNLPDKADQFNINHWNQNTEKLDGLIKARENEFYVHNSNLENPHQVKGSQLVEPVPTEKIADLSIITSKIADKNVTVEKLAEVIQQCLSPVGTIRTGLWKTAPDGWLLCDGSKVLISDYPNLYQCAVDNGWLKQDSDTTRFFLPDLRARFLQGARENLGEMIEAGLPNITGTFSGNDDNAREVYTGSFSLSETPAPGQGAGSGKDILAIFDASKGETKTDGILKTDDEYHVYGKSDTVQPPAFTVNYIIKY